MIRRMNRRTRRFFNETSTIMLILWIIGIGVFISLFVPWAVPPLNRGAICTNLPAPKGGNSRSLLALSNQHQKMDLQVEVVGEEREGSPDIFVRSGTELLVRLTFDNNDVGPITLYYEPDREVIGSFSTLDAQNAMGVVFEIRPVGSDFSASDNPSIRSLTPQQNQFGLDELYILPAESRCYIEFRFTPERLQQIGVTAGEYRIRAYYRNRQPGTYIPATPSGNRPAPTAMFADQGIWIGTVQSNEVRFRIE